MARLNTRAVSSDTESERASSSPARHTPDTSETPPSPTNSSDKENEQQSRKSKGKRKSTSSAMPDRTPAESQKRRRTGGEASQTPSTQQYYDPDQDPEERRQVRKGLRGLFARLNDSRNEYLQPNSKGLEQTLKEADELYNNVKQTSEATIDSRLLVETADLSYRKINNLTLGDGSTGIDVDDFITKCIVFMKQGDESDRQTRNEPPRTQTQRRGRRHDDEDDDAGDTMNWDYLGKNACFLYNSRPCLTGFMLGPLSVQKKVRQQTQRKAREARADPSQAVRPLQLGEGDLEKQESANLTEICTEIANLLRTAMRDRQENAEREMNDIEGEVSEEQVEELFRLHGIADNGCLPLFNFCINPKSFGQSVENLFYVSFLIKEGKVGLDFDGRNLPTLGMVDERTLEERQETQRNQAVFTLSFDIWEEIIKSFGLEKSIIPHRLEENYDDGTLDYAALEGDNARREDYEDSDAYS